MNTPVLAPPDHVAGYKLGSLIGRGGMSLVYRAEHTELGRTVALKFLHPSLAEDDSFRSRFLREARLAASIDHPNVLPIYEAGEADGWLYFSMRYVEGPNLGDLLKTSGPLDGPTTLRVVSATGRALSAAHRAGLVHRDVKPQNILIDRRAGGTEHIYLCDFGLTKDLASKTRHTMSGQLMGSVHYASPEQIDGKALDARTDVYSLGCVLYECLTGEPPFLRDSDLAVLWAHVGSLPPSIRSRRRHLPKAVDDVIAVAMAKTPEARYASCDQMVADLERAFSDQAGRTEARALLRSDPTAYRGARRAFDLDPYRVQRTPVFGGARSIAIGVTAAMLAGSAAFALAGQFVGNADPRSKARATGARPGSPTQDVDADRVQLRETQEMDSGASRTSGHGFAAPALVPGIPEAELGALNGGIPQAFRVTNVDRLPYPPSGRYTFRQTGETQLCHNRNGFEVCPATEDLPERQHLDVTHVPGFNGGDVLLLKSSSDGYSTEVVTRYGQTHAAITRESATFRHQGAEFSFSIRPTPRITALQRPLQVGNRWTGAWTGGTSGKYASEIVARERYRVAGRSVRVARIDTQMQFWGKNRGHIVTSEWLDLSTGVVVRTVASLRWSDGVGTLKASFQRQLTNGPAYR